MGKLLVFLTSVKETVAVISHDHGLVNLLYEERLRELSMVSFEKRRLRWEVYRTLLPCSIIQRVPEKNVETFFQGVTWKRREVMSASCSWGDSGWTHEENFSQWKQSAIRIILMDKWWIGQHWILLRCNWRGCWGILSKQCFAKKRWTRWSLGLLPTWYSEK